jgi:TolB protein
MACLTVAVAPAHDRRSAGAPQGIRTAESPRVSPDGRHIAFLSRETGQADLYVADADGAHPRPLTRTPAGEEMHAWAPDGSRIAFVRMDSDVQALFVINADGSGERKIVTGFPKNQFPSWSPDGRRLVLNMDGPQAFGVFVMNVDGSGQRNLGRGMQPAWSPDGKSIAFAVGGPRINVMTVDGLDRRQVSQGGGAHEMPAWSPDGRRIAYQASLPRVNGKANAEVRVVNADGTGDVPIGVHAAAYLDEAPSWFPDGQRLAIQSDRDGTMAIYVIDLNGKVLARIPK